MPKLDASAINALYQQRVTQGEHFTPFIDSPSDAVFYFILVGGDTALRTDENQKSCDIHYMLRAAGGLMDDVALDKFVKKRVNSFRVSLSRVKTDFRNKGQALIPFSAAFIKGERLQENSNDVRMTWRFITDQDSIDFSNVLHNTVD